MAAKVDSLKKLLVIISLILLELLDTSVATKKVKNLHNVDCRTPHETVVALDPSNHEYYPFFVKLHRCSGSWRTVSPTVRHCVPNAFEEVSIRVYSRAKKFQATTITVRNHTSCTHECVASADDCDFTVEDWNDNACACKCRYPDGPPKELACKQGFRWNRHRCRCECARAPDHCPLRMTWSDEICGCRCENSAVNECTKMKMGIDVDCKCVNVLAIGNRPGVTEQHRMFITLLIGQAALIIILVCALVHWVRKSRQNAAHSPLDRSDSSKTDDDINSPYLEVAVESGSSVSLQDSAKDPDDITCTAPLSPKARITDL